MTIGAAVSIVVTIVLLGKHQKNNVRIVEIDLSLQK